MDFDKLRVIFGYFFKANPMVRSLYTSYMMRLLYTSTDMEKHNSITSDN